MLVVVADDGRTNPSSAPGGSSTGLGVLRFKVVHVPGVYGTQDVDAHS